MAVDSGQLIISYLLWDVWHRLCSHNVNLDESKGRGSHLILRNYPQERHLGEQAMFGGP